MTEFSTLRRKVWALEIVLVCVALAACRTGPSAEAKCEDVVASRAHAGPSAVVVAYADALAAGDLETAFSLLDPESRGALEDFRTRYRDPQVRQARAEALRGSASSLRVVSNEVGAVERDGWKVIDAAPRDAAAVLEAFLDAAERRDFDAAFSLLARDWRAQYTPQQLAKDFEQEPLAKARLTRARVALTQPPEVEAGAVVYPLGAGKAVRLVREGTSFKVAALE